MAGQEPIVIIGAGEAGATLAAELVRLGYRDPVHLVGDEDCAPYERPPLSKAHLEPGAEPLPATVFPQGMVLDNVVHHRGLAAVSIDPKAKLVTLSNGGSLAYHRLVLATGAEPRTLGLAEGIGGVHYLRTLAQARDLRNALDRRTPVAVLGAGFIGLEVAAAARRHGCKVTMVEPQPRILGRGVSAFIAERIRLLHEAEGVDFRLGASLSALQTRGAELILHLTEGAAVEASALVIGIGAQPRIALARAAGLAIDNGIAVDAQFTTSDPAILAMGDCCSFPLPVYGGRRVRLESWRNARDQAAMIAAILTKGDVASMPVPWFWSDQYDHGLQVAGLVDEGETEIRRPVGDGADITFHLADDGRLVAACGFGPGQAVAKDIRLAEMLIARGAMPDPGLLADPAVKLKSLL